MLIDANILEFFCCILLRLRYNRNKFISDVIFSKKNIKRISDDKKRLKFNMILFLSKHLYKERVTVDRIISTKISLEPTTFVT